MTDVPLVLVVDDDQAMQDSIAYLLASVGIDCACFSCAQHALESEALWAGGRPGCILLDVRMPGMSGIEFLRLLKERGCPLPVVVVTAHGDVPLAVAALKAGAEDFIEKPSRDQCLLDAINAAIRKSRDLLTRNADRVALRARLAVLSRREREVLALVLKGRQNKAIAADLNISIKTVEGHRHALMEKMGTRSVAELARMMAGAIEPPCHADHVQG